MRILSPLDRKLTRDLWAARGQAVAIMLVIACGLGLFIMSNGMLRSLDETRTAYYDRYRFADVFAPVVRAPMRLVRDIQNIPGVSTAEGRISGNILFDIPDTAEPVSGRVVSIPDIGEAKLNTLFLREGRMFKPFREDEVLLSESFAQAHGLEPGDTVLATMHGAKRRFTVVGLALSPEFIYTIAPGELIPDDKRFGVMWMGYEGLAAAFDLDGAFNEAIATLGRDVNQDAVIATLDRILDPYGATGAYAREDQISHKFLSSELDQLRTMGRLMPTIFLAVAAFLLNIVVTRLIEAEREQIGLMKAFGYSDLTVALHYLKFILLIATAGLLFGCILGIYLGHVMAALYQDFFKFPFLIFRMEPDLFATSAAVSFGAASLGVVTAVRRAAALNPAIAMRPPAPTDYSRTIRFGRNVLRFLDQPTRMILRQLARRPLRAVLTTVGIAFAGGILVMSRFNVSATNFMIDVSFHVAERQDISVAFAESQSMTALYELKSLEGVRVAEPYRAVPVRLHNGHIMRVGGVTGVNNGAVLSRPIDTDLQPIRLPPNGLVLSQKLAELMKVSVGERLTLAVQEDRRPTVDVNVVGIAETYLGTPAFMQLDALNRTLREGSRISGAHLSIDKAHIADVYRALKDMPMVSGVTLWREAEAAFQRTMDESIGTFTAIVTLFAGLIAMGVVYNSARIALAERSRELASLRVMGFTKAEVSYVLLGELAILTVLAVPLGCALGYVLSWYLVSAFDTELYQIPLVITRDGYGFAGAVIFAAAALSGFLVQRNISKLDMVAVLKTRD